MLPPTTGTSLDPALPGSIMRQEGSNISRCKPYFNNCTPKKGLYLEIFDPSRRMIEPANYFSKYVNQNYQLTFKSSVLTKYNTPIYIEKLD